MEEDPSFRQMWIIFFEHCLNIYLFFIFGMILYDIFNLYYKYYKDAGKLKDDGQSYEKTPLSLLL